MTNFIKKSGIATQRLREIENEGGYSPVKSIRLLTEQVAIIVKNNKGCFWTKNRDETAGKTYSIAGNILRKLALGLGFNLGIKDDPSQIITTELIPTYVEYIAARQTPLGNLEYIVVSENGQIGRSVTNGFYAIDYIVPSKKQEG